MNKLKADLMEVIVRALSETYRPEALLLFGSYAWGFPGENSDIDIMVVVQNSMEKIYKRPVSGYRALMHFPKPLDILVYTKEEFNRSAEDETSLCRKILERGEVLYGHV